MSLIDVIQKVRPAPVQVFLVRLLGLNRRRDCPFGELTFHIDPSSQFGSHLIRSDYEPEMVAVLETYLKPGGVFLDIGANEGFFTVLGSKLVGEGGRVVAIEPQNRLLPVIAKNLELNGCDNVRVENCVLGEAAGEVVIHLAPETNTGSTSMYAMTRYKLQTQTVECVPLAQLLDRAGLDHVDLVKIDTEGAEYDILMPAGEVLRSGRLRTIALEYHPSVLAKRGLSMDEIHQLMVTSGYRLDDEDGNSMYHFVGAS